MSDKYNGWTNYETWNVALWMGESDEYYRDLLRGETDTYKASQTLKSSFEDDMPELGVGPYCDLLGAAVSSVNWYEIAEHWIEDSDEDEAI
jgi:hypothetical protein